MRRSHQPNRDHWNATSARYQSSHADALVGPSKAWGSWRVPESEVDALGDLTGQRVLELGCGAGQWSAALADDGVAVVGLDLSDEQLSAAVRHMRSRYPLVQGAAEELPFADETFDVVFCDHGGLSWGDPYQVVPEVSRVLRPDGRLVFAATSPIMAIAYDDEADRVSTSLKDPYFDLYTFAQSGGATNYALTYGAWVRLFVQNAMVIEDLIEPRPAADATTTYYALERADWAHRWPAEVLWIVRRLGA